MTENEKYTDILNRSWDDIPEAKLLPVGTWLLRGNNVGVFPPKEEGQATRVAFFYQAKEPMDDVREDELAALGEDYSYSENDVVKQFFINRNKDWDSVRKHLELHGIDSKGKTQIETFKEFKGTEVLSFVDTKTFTSNTGETRTENNPTSFTRLS